MIILSNIQAHQCCDLANALAQYDAAQVIRQTKDALISLLYEVRSEAAHKIVFPRAADAAEE